MSIPKRTAEQPTFPGIELDAQKTLPLGEPTNGSAKRTEDSVGPANLGKPIKVLVPDFSNPKRAKTCLEVDFPIVPVNALSQLEGNAGKPIY